MNEYFYRHELGYVTTCNSFLNCGINYEYMCIKGTNALAEEKRAICDRRIIWFSVIRSADNAILYAYFQCLFGGGKRTLTMV